ncbi:MAG TPA: acetyltransferase [Bryobacteraceae bacterium]|jgi:predicted GNAT superfamily acetyltransferase|nr:acetyltransferase [Bryobacteraceae bacterium]
MAGIEVRQLSELSEFSDVVRLQQEIWGFDELELLPRRLFVVASKIGGQVLGAFDKGQMVAFCLCIPGLKPGGKYYLHSHMLGVLAAYRNTGLGRRMKLEQRLYAMAAGIDLIEWTFDPLELKNAFFNLERLGAIVRRYVRNQYGTTSSHLHGGLPTDRLVPEWWIESDRVGRLIEERPKESIQVQERIPVPSDIAQIRKREPGRAREIQAGLAENFEQYFQAGLAVIGFERTEATGTYLLGECPFK